MAPPEGIVLEFQCTTTSLFHTARQEYDNLIKCAPFVLGTTLRGAVLNHLIRQHCPPSLLDVLEQLTDPSEIAQAHQSCDIDCPVKAFYEDTPSIHFSFGILRGDPQIMRTRIALERSTTSVAEGAIVSLEAFPPKTDFNFAVILEGEASDMKDIVIEAVRDVGRILGIGRLRSIGFGHFEIRLCTDEALSSYIERKRQGKPEEFWGNAPTSLIIEFTTPYVLEGGEQAPSVDGAILAQKLESEFAGQIAIGNVEAQIQPDFVSRFSFESHVREHHLVAWPGSRFILTEIQVQPGWQETLVESLAFGIGPLSEVGFGQFTIGTS
jgi:hypothetical protein